MIKLVEIDGQQRPVLFSLWAKSLIADALGINFDDFLNGIQLSGASLTSKLIIAMHGLNEGNRKTGNKYKKLELRQEVADLLETRPDALDEIIAVYFIQVFGPQAEEYLKNVKKVLADPPEGVEVEALKTSTEQIKKAWATVTKTANRLPSPGSRK